MLFTKRELNDRAKEVYRTTEDYSKHFLYNNEFYEVLKTLGGELFDDTKDDDAPEMAFMKACRPTAGDDKNQEIARYCLGLGAQTLCNDKKRSIKDVFSTDQYDARQEILKRIEQDPNMEEIDEACFRSAYTDYRKAGYHDDIDLLWEYYTEDLIENCDHANYEVVDDEDPITGREFSYVRCPVCGRLGHRNIYQTEDGYDGDVEWE